MRDTSHTLKGWGESLDTVFLRPGREGRDLLLFHQISDDKKGSSPKSVLQCFDFGGTNKVLVNRDPLECFTAFGGFLFCPWSASLLLGCLFFHQLAMANMNEINNLRSL
nr:hypothetical protein [Thioclava dalianensis]